MGKDAQLGQSSHCLERAVEIKETMASIYKDEAVLDDYARRKRPSWTVLTDCCRWGSVRMRAIDLIGEDVFFQRFLNGLVEADQQLDQAFAFTPLQHG